MKQLSTVFNFMLLAVFLTVGGVFGSGCMLQVDGGSQAPTAPDRDDDDEDDTADDDDDAPNENTGPVDTVGCVDEDGDSYGDNCDSGPDCNDADSAVNPIMTEVPDNGIDDDCDPITYDSSSCVDNDGDGWGDGCLYSPDCDDSDANVNPVMTEIPDNGKDDDCNDATPDTAAPVCVDNDLDGHDAIDPGCPTGDDCDDNDDLVNPDWTEIPNNFKDDDCDPTTPDSGGAPAVNLTAGLVAHYQFNEGTGNDVVDSSPSGADATGLDGLMGGAAWSIGYSGLAGDYAITCDGSGQCFYKGDEAFFNPNGNALAYSVWIKPTTLEFSAIVAHDGAYGGKEGWYLSIEDDGVGGWEYRCNWADNTAAYHYVAAPALAAGAWTNVACSYDGINARLYVNGVVVQETNLSVILNTPAATALEMGRIFLLSNSAYPGSIDDVRIYNRPLSDADAAAIFAE